ncbi:helix-turn-helix domain-containing protein [Jatrophihabitans fulvus]
MSGMDSVWAGIASEVLPRAARDITERIRTEVPELHDDASGVVSLEAGRAVREAMAAFLSDTVAGLPPGARTADAFRRLGRQEAHAGRSHDTLQSIYRIASQSVLTHLLDWEREHDVPREVMASLSAAVFGFIDDLARFSAEGHAAAVAAALDASHARGELLAMLVHPDGANRRQLAAAARRADWTLPATATVIEAVDGPVPSGLVGEGALVAWVGDRALAVVPGPVDPEALRSAVRAAALDVLLVVGPSVPLVEVGSAARLAHRLRLRHDVRQRAVDGVVTCDESMVEIVLDSSRDAMRALASSRLLPLAALSPAKRVKYGRLLSAWLEFGTLAADEPGVLDKHRQTLRYQCGQLEKMFGDALHDRTARLELMLALRAALPLWERQAGASR